MSQTNNDCLQNFVYKFFLKQLERKNKILLAKIREQLSLFVNAITENQRNFVIGFRSIEKTIEISITTELVAFRENLFLSKYQKVFENSLGDPEYDHQYFHKVIITVDGKNIPTGNRILPNDYLFDEDGCQHKVDKEIIDLVRKTLG